MRLFTSLYLLSGVHLPVLGFFDGHADVEGRKHREDKGLQVGNQTLQQVDKHTEDNAENRNCTSSYHAEELANNIDNEYI